MIHGAAALAGSHDATGAFPLWRDFQAFMNEKGIELETINTVDFLMNTSGGIRRQSSFTGDVDLLLTVDTERLFHWDDGTLFLYGLGLYGEDPSQNVGDVQAVSSIAAPNTWKLYEAWYQHNFQGNRFSVLAGLYDVTSEFDVIRSSSELFLNGSFGTGGDFAVSGANGPSTFPFTSLGIRGQAILSDSIAIRAVVADGIPGDPDNPNGTKIIVDQDDGLFMNGEIAFYTFRRNMTREAREDVVTSRPLRLVFQRVRRAAPVEYDGKYALGIWGYTTELADLSERDASGNAVKRQGTYGIYGLAEQIVFREEQDREQGLALFGRIGFADPRVNRFSQYYGGGLTYTGLFPGRDLDVMGIGAAATLNGSHFLRAARREGQAADAAEIALELTYAIHVAPEIVIQPDVQYVINPDTDPNVQDALVVGLRLGINLNWFEGPSAAIGRTE